MPYKNPKDPRRTAAREREKVKARSKYVPHPKIIGIARCHPDRKHAAKGLCKQCYDSTYLEKWYAANRGHCIAYAIAKYETPEGRVSRMVNAARDTARRRGWEFSITAADVAVPIHCPLLGILLNPAAGSRADSLPSLDRKDSSRGYVPDNVWVVSWKANQIKNRSTLEDLKLVVAGLERQAIVDFRRKSRQWFLRSVA
jgi:hypothetical protein